MQRILIIHVESRPDTAIFNRIYKNIHNTNVRVLFNPSREDVRHELHDYTYRRIVLIGHGDINGLYNSDWSGYTIDNSFVSLLRGRNVVGIWCYATEFARRYGLSGFFTSMFISNVEEAIEHGFDISDGDIEYLSTVFSEHICEFLSDSLSLDEWYDTLMGYSEVEEFSVARYNYEAMEYFEKEGE